jgi:hypothetical protein
MASSEEKMVVFSAVTKAFFDAVSTVEVRFMISHSKEVNGGHSFANNVLSKKQEYYDERYLLEVPSYTGQTSLDLSFASCADQLLTSRTGKYISKVRLIFYAVSPESMLTFDTVRGCEDYYLDPKSTFNVNDGVCVQTTQQ